MNGITKEQQAVLDAASQWWCERQVMNWDDAELARAVIRLHGDWPGCPECDHQCGEPCMPATIAEQLSAVDCAIAQLAHDGKLSPPDGYKPPDGWTPLPTRRSSSLLEVQQAQHTRAVTSLVNILRGLVGEPQPRGIDRPVYQNALREPTRRNRGGKIQRLPRRDLLRRVDVRVDELRGLLRAPGHTRQRHRRSHQR